MPKTNVSKTMAHVLLFGLGCAWVGFWPTLVLMVGPSLIEED